MKLIDMIQAGHPDAPERLTIALRAVDGSFTRVAKTEGIDVRTLRAAVERNADCATAAEATKRPRHGLHAPDTAQIAFYAPLGAKARLQALSDSLGKSPSLIMREILEDFLKKHGA